MFVHAVYFYCYSPLSSDDQIAFVNGLKNLALIKSVTNLFVGPPVASEDPVVNTGFTYALTVLFSDKESHDQYQVDPIHLEFIEQYSRL